MLCGTGGLLAGRALLRGVVGELQVAQLGVLGAFDELGHDVDQVCQAGLGGVVADPVGGQSATGAPLIGGCQQLGVVAQRPGGDGDGGVPADQQR